MADRFTAQGILVLKDGNWMAMAKTPEAANALAVLLNRGVFICSDVSGDEFKAVLKELWG